MKSEFIEESNNIYVRPWLDNDATEWFTLSQNEGLNQFSISGYRQKDMIAAKRFIQEWIRSFANERIGVFPIILRVKNELIGVCGLKKVTFDGETSQSIEIMYRISDQYWGQGMAAEAAHILLDYAFKKLQLHEVLGFIEKANVRSEKVLKKIGMKFLRIAKYHGRTVEVYSISKATYVAQIEFLNRFRDDGLIVKLSPMHGFGVFASRKFIKGESVVKWKNSRSISEAEFLELPESEKNYTDIQNGKFILVGVPERFVNHSCDPNTTPGDRCDIATRDIAPDEEITADYNHFYIHGGPFRCNCPSANCIGTVKGKAKSLIEL